MVLTNSVYSRRFFEDYKKTENKEVAVATFLGVVEAVKAVQNSIDLYGQYVLQTLQG